MAVRTDALLEKLFQAVDRLVGLENVLVVLTADHGVAPNPEVNRERKMPGGRVLAGTVSKAVVEALVKKYGEGNWVLTEADNAVYLNLPLIEQKNLDRAEVGRIAAQAAMAIPHVFRVFTREQLNSGIAMDDFVGRRAQNGYYLRRGPDIEVMLEPYWIFGKGKASHSTIFSYDSHVPVIFMGQGIRPGRYSSTIAVNDIAPTLATLLDVETPAGSVGRVLSEMFD